MTGFSFEFRIGLHVDDLAVLQFIKDKLGIGNITIKSTGDICTFSVSNEEGIYALISIFDKYNLNTTKYLDYLDFRKAFILYKERDKSSYFQYSLETGRRDWKHSEPHSGEQRQDQVVGTIVVVRN